MNDTLTLNLIHDAQSNGLEGTRAVLEAMSGRIDRLAASAAQRMAQNGFRYDDYREDFAQDASLAMFEALPRFNGATVDAFFAFMYTTIESTLKDKVRSQRNGGVDPDAIKVFASMLEMADGDVYLAERLAQTVPPKGRRLSADRAEAARLAWQGTSSLDAPAITINGPTAGSVSQGDYSASYSAADSLASTLGVPDELVTAEDLNSEDRRVKHAIIHAVLDVMGEAQRVVIKHSFGIGEVVCYGHGDSGDDEGLAAEIGSTVLKVRDARTKGLKAFAKRYISATATSEAEAKQMTEAAAANLSRGGRK